MAAGPEPGRYRDPVIRTRPALDAIPEYVPGRSAESVAAKYAIGDVIKLASNEASFGPLPAALAAIEVAARIANRYPDDAATTLRRALGAHYAVDPEQVLLANGSVELCRMAMAATCDPGDEVLFAWPSFEAYPVLAQQIGATMVQVPLVDHRHDLDAMAGAITDRTGVVFVCNPNNPTGTTVGIAAAERFLDRVPRDLLVVFDEAYREFVTAPDHPDGLELLLDHPNVAVLRTFSKAYGLAALRVGYAIAAVDVIGALRKVRVPFTTNALAQAAALASIDAHDEMRERVDEVIAERARVTDGLADIGLPVVESEANFVWLPLGDGAAVLTDYCERAGVVLRGFPGVGVRITIGTRDENDRLLRVVQAASDDGATG
jgi:histidinol-phosphate aminotransferase